MEPNPNPSPDELIPRTEEYLMVCCHSVDVYPCKNGERQRVPVRINNVFHIALLQRHVGGRLAEIGVEQPHNFHLDWFSPCLERFLRKVKIPSLDGVEDYVIIGEAHEAWTDVTLRPGLYSAMEPNPNPSPDELIPRPSFPSTTHYSCPPLRQTRTPYSGAAAPAPVPCFL